MKNNPVFQVLVVTNPTILAAANEVTDLAVGQLGVFNAANNQSVALNAAMPDKWYLAVGIDDKGTGALADINKSAGEFIETALLNRVDSAAYTPSANQVISLDLSAFVPQYATDYVVRLELQSGQTMNLNGFMNPIKTFVYSTPSNGTGDYTLATFVTNLVAAINTQAADEGLIVAADAGSSVVTLTIGAEDKELTINGINKRYDLLRQLSAKWGLSGGFETDGVVTVTSTGPTYEQGSGYDIQQMEYVAGGWIGNPGVYRESELNGVLQAPIVIRSVAGSNYWTMRFNYNRRYTSGGSLQYDSILETVIAVEQNATNFTFINSLITWVNTYLPNPGDTTTVVTTSTTTTTTTTV